MKALLGCLLCYVLFAAECFAHKGGPNYGGNGVVTTGNYAGVLIPTNDNSLGLFSVSVPSTGLANGTVALFRNGYFYPGTIQAIADPDSAILTGVVDATFNISFASVDTSTSPPTTTTFVVTFNANGSITAKIRANRNAFSTATERLDGTAAITYTTVGDVPGFDTSVANSDGPITYVVDGFKQSEVTGL